MESREAERRGLDNSALAQRRLEATPERKLGDLVVETVVHGASADRAVETTPRAVVALIISRGQVN